MALPPDAMMSRCCRLRTNNQFQIPMVVVLRQHLTGTTTWAETSSSTRGSHRQAPRHLVTSPAGTTRPLHEQGRQTRRSAKVGRPGMVQPNHPAQGPLLSFRGFQKGFDPPGQHKLPYISACARGRKLVIYRIRCRIRS
jgi:hypothetical protein